MRTTSWCAVTTFVPRGHAERFTNARRNSSSKPRARTRNASGSNIETELQTKGKAFDRKVATLVSENEELAQKLAHYNMLVTMVAERNKK